MRLPDRDNAIHEMQTWKYCFVLRFHISGVRQEQGRWRKYSNETWLLIQMVEIRDRDDLLQDRNIVTKLLTS